MFESKNPEDVIVQFNDRVLEALGEEQAVQYKLEYTESGKAYKLYHPSKPKGERRSLSQLAEFLSALVQKPAEGEKTVQELLESEDPLTLMSGGVILRGKGHLLIAKAYHLHKTSDNADDAAFRRDLQQTYGLDLPSDSTLKKAGPVWRRFVVEAQERGVQVDFDLLSKCSLFRLYQVSGVLDRHDWHQVVNDVRKGMTEEQLNEKYIRSDTRSNVTVWKTFRMPESDYRTFESLQQKLSKVAGEQGEFALTPLQMMNAVLGFADELAENPEMAKRLWSLMMEQGQAERAPKVPRGEDGRLDMMSLSEGYTPHEITLMVREGAITPADIQDHPEAFADLLGGAPLPQVETDYEVTEA